jgi:hypothetical protein
MNAMSRKRAVRRLYSQHRTEWNFGWHDPDLVWRKKLKEIYPVDFVASNHRRDVPPSMMNDHARRMMVFHQQIKACR